MASHPSASEQQQVPSPTSASGSRSCAQFVRRSFCALVILLAIFQFSENTTDPDLWGHVFFGRAMIHNHAVPKIETYSWTAKGQPWINHECLAGIILAATYNCLGGSGILLLKMTLGLLTFAFCLYMGTTGLAWPGRFVTWGLGALAVVEISFGFPARPQIFTALCVALELLLLRRIHAEARWWALLLPPMFVFWINAHGGALAGVGLLGVAAAATTGGWLWAKMIRKNPATLNSQSSENLKTVVVLWLAVPAVIAALFCNPWGAQLVRFLVKSVLWMRPEIEEWNPTPLAWDHAAAFILIGLTIFAWAFTRRQRTWWEMAVCGAFAVLALRSVRNAPLFCIVALALVPPHLASALERFKDYFGRWEILALREDVQKIAGVVFVIAAFGIGIATFTLHKEHPLTMSVPRSEYPVSAIKFMNDHELRGRLVVFFDWGEMTIFHLPDCPPSIDPRLDTCYSRELIAAHWKFYNGEPFDEKVFNPFEADLVLLPVKQAGALTVAHHPGWKAVYYDDTAVVLAHNVDWYPKLRGLAIPAAGPKEAALGRAVFGDVR